MFPVAGIETLAGGDTGSEPYKGKKGAARWQKMRENVIKEWEAEQVKKGANEEEKQPQSIDGDASTSSKPANEVETAKFKLAKSAGATVDLNKELHKKGKDTKSANSTMDKLKEKLFRH